MSSSQMALFQQQAALATHKPQSNSGGPWQWWTPYTIATATRAPVASVQQNWPLVYDALESLGIADKLVCMGAIGTIAVETAHTFEPVREAYWLSEAWRAANLTRYYPYYGRGFIQLTWYSNYSAYGAMVGADLVNNPDLAMQPDIAARVFAWFFVGSRVDDAAMAQDWAEVRRRVQGAYAGLDELRYAIAVLGA